MFSFHRQGNRTQSHNSTYPKPHDSQWKPVSLCSQAKGPFHAGAYEVWETYWVLEQVPCKDKNAEGPFSKSLPFGVLALIQHDDCCPSCFSICAIVNQLDRRTHSGPKNETHVHHISRSLGEPVSVKCGRSSVRAQRDPKGYLYCPVVVKLLGCFVCLFIFLRNVMLQGILLYQEMFC